MFNATGVFSKMIPDRTEFEAGVFIYNYMNIMIVIEFSNRAQPVAEVSVHNHDTAVVFKVFPIQAEFAVGVPIRNCIAVV